ncbi:M15 family metallopeptidase [Peribacillus tepidiphilus]|uniref:M15 family metallopeptidase n=1 Tax=Peribacillus tepidiphilus TaxID=2652445 RepID=UPI0012926384|nr:M15 family metallopeptidase [Peribacillus tepidiphilus]
MLHKKYGLFLLSIIFLSGCQVKDLIPEGFHFISQQENTTKEQTKQKVEQNTKEKEENSAATKGGIENEEELTLDSQFFNEIQEVNGKKLIQNPENFLVLVNKEYSLNDDYAPKDLVRPNVAFSFGFLEQEKALMRKEAARALEQMFQEAKLNGIELYAVSAYRSFERQKMIFDAEINRVGREKAIEAVAYPGQSEHQTGLAVDISSKSVNLLLIQEFENTPEGKWLALNAHHYGFILRYPKGKEEITGYKFEPWHFRYVGKDLAEILYEKGLTLEEYFSKVKAI